MHHWKVTPQCRRCYRPSTQHTTCCVHRAAYNMLCAPCRIQHATFTVHCATCSHDWPKSLMPVPAVHAARYSALALPTPPVGFQSRRSNAVEVACRPCAVESTSTRTACVPLWPKPSGLQLRLPHRELRRVRPAASCSACCGPRECVSQRPTLSTHSH
jgi:hypothetical protein